VRAFQPSNVGYEVHWPTEFLKESVRQPLKNCILTTAKGSKQGELMITEYGLEGTPVYFVGKTGSATLDLKPALSAEALLNQLQKSRENLSAHRRLKKLSGLCQVALSLLYHSAPQANLVELVGLIKSYPLELLKPRPLSEAISSQGGVALSELERGLNLKRYPHTYCIGEMLDWDAPTGGFLIQAAVTQGVIAASDIALRYPRV
jgi:predicted flavoprotein YhiN